MGEVRAVGVITTTFTTTPRQVLRSYRACHPWAVAVRWLILVVLVLEGLFVGSPLLVVFGVTWFAYGTYRVRRQLRPYLQGEREVTVTITDEAYEVTGPSGVRTWPWSTVQRVVRRGGFWVLQLSKTAALSLPVTALDAGQTAEWEAHLRSSGLIAT